MDTLTTILLISLVLCALWTIMTRSLIRSAIGLGLTSAVLTIIIFRLGAAWAGVFELSVCSGLISVVFISTITMAQPLTQKERLKHMKDRLQRFSFLPALVVLVAIALAFARVVLNPPVPCLEVEHDVRVVLWNTRTLDLVGQMIIMLVGVFGVIVLFREGRRE